MRILLICLAFIAFSINVLALRDDEGYVRYDYSDDSDDYNQRVVPYAVNSRARKIDVPIVGDVANFVFRQVEWAINVVKCLVTCFNNYLYKSVCNQMFPCLYDCFVGATFVSSAVEKRLKDMNPFAGKRPSLGLRTVYTVFKCLASCAKGIEVTNWESFAYVLYCVAEQCICFHVFGQ